jgi:hypothetical protein
VPIVGTVVVRTPFSTRSRERTDVRDGFDLGAGGGDSLAGVARLSEKSDR